MAEKSAVKPIAGRKPPVCRLGLFMSLILLSAVPTALAEQKGALPDYGPGFGIGAPFAALPTPGLYWSQKLAFSSAQLVNGAGNDTGIHTNVWLSTSFFLVSTDYHVLGARYGAFVYNAGIYHGNIIEPKGVSGTVTSAADFEFDPIDLSWSLGNGFSFGISEGFNPPAASFDPDRLINIGHDRWTFQQHVNLSYVTSSYLLAANGLFSVNGANQSDNYKSGSTTNLDLTAVRRFGPFETGPVGYYFNQFGGDSGPMALNGGKPTEVAVGWLVGWQIGKWSLNTYLTQDVYARNIGKQTKIWISIARPIFQ
jgi:hypothetical protein